MAVSRPDGLPPYENYRDYNFNDKSTFISDDMDSPVAFSSYQHDDVDKAFDPLSTNRRLNTDIAVLGTVIVAGPRTASIQILVPDCLSPPVDNAAQIDLRHVIELQLGFPIRYGYGSTTTSRLIHLTRHCNSSAGLTGKRLAHC